MSADPMPPTVGPTPLPKTLPACHAMIRELLETLRKYAGRLERLEHQLEHLLRRLYGRSAERLDPNQLALFEDCLKHLGPQAAPAPEPPVAAAASPSPARGHGRRRIPQDLPQLWRDPKTSDQDRKRMVRLLIEDVTLVKAQEVRVQIRFRAGATRTLTLPLPPNAWQRRMTRPEVVAEIDRLLETCTEEQIADGLNQQGHRSGTGQPFTPRLVSKIRRAYHLRSCYDRLRQAGMLTLSEVARQLGVNTKTVKIWRNHGLLTAHPYNDKKECLYEPVGQNAPAKQQGIRLSERTQAARVIPNPTNEVYHGA